VKKLDVYLGKRKEVLKQERAIITLLNIKKELYLMLKARIIKPSENDIQGMIKRCNKLNEKILSKNVDNQEFNCLKKIPLNDIMDCYYFIEKAISILIKTNIKYQWYMAPIAAATMTLGEMLILIVTIVTIGLLII
jgi:hypothetical protein